MNKDMTIIELINKIANEEGVPQKIKYKDTIYIYSEKDQDYVECNKDDFDLLGYAFCNWITRDFINDKVEILEEDKPIIEKIDIENDSPTHFYIKNEYGTKCSLTKHSKIIVEKLNEVIEYTNSFINDLMVIKKEMDNKENNIKDEDNK